MSTLEEIVRHVEHVAYSNDDKALVCMGIKEYRELAVLLRELQERRKEPEIVRCGECKHSITYNGVKYVCCEIHNTYPNENYFCGDAERRTDD